MLPFSSKDAAAAWPGRQGSDEELPTATLRDMPTLLLARCLLLA